MRVENVNDDYASLETDGFQDANVMSEHDVDINAPIIIGTGQESKFHLGDRLMSRWSYCRQQTGPMVRSCLCERLH